MPGRLVSKKERAPRDLSEKETIAQCLYWIGIEDEDERAALIYDISGW